MPHEKSLFISHASADKALADHLRSCLVLGGVPSNQIFYSSSRNTGVPAGRDVHSFLKSSLQGAGLVIELVSETFLARPTCLMELGGAWALDVPTYPIVIPPLSRDDAVRAIGNVQMAVLDSTVNTDEAFSELFDRLAKDLGVKAKLTAWTQQTAKFRDGLAAALAASRQAPAPQRMVNSAAHSTGTDSSDDDELSIGNIAVSRGAYNSRDLHAEVTNKDQKAHAASIRATFYDADGRIVGTADDFVDQLRPGRTKTIHMADVPDHASVKVEVDSLFED